MSEQASEQTATIEFLDAFFGPGNDAGNYPGVTEGYRKFVLQGDTTPIVLPRFDASAQEATMYVIANDSLFAPHVPDLITAFAGPTYCKTMDLVPRSMDPHDPVEAAVIKHFGTDTPTYVLSAGPNQNHRQRLRRALDRMQTTVSGRPQREWRVDKPLGRLLGEFDAALSAGGEATSGEILAQIVARGGLTASNLAHLRIKRLSKLGLNHDLLAMPDLIGVLQQTPPIRIREAVLEAVYQTTLAMPLSDGDVVKACELLRDLEPPLPLPFHDPVELYEGHAAAVLVTAAIGRADSDALARVLDLRETEWASGLPEALWDSTALLAATKTSRPATAIRLDEVPLLTSWGDFITAVVEQEKTAISAVKRDDTWRTWPTLEESDAEVSQILSSLADHEWPEVWNVVGMIIDASGERGSAPATTRDLLVYALSAERLSRGDLLSLYALTEIHLRSAPNSADYAALLRDLGASAAQWASIQTSDIVLDFADRLVLAPCPDVPARTMTGIAFLDPLRRHHSRLDPEEFNLARQLCEELELSIDWPEPTDEEREFTLSEVRSLSVLLYSLDQAVLARVSDQLTKQAKNLKISTSYDKVGSNSLKQKSRNADVIVLATRCAKHAATGFITENKNPLTRMEYADGSGSASLLRAAVRGIRDAVR